MIRLDSPRVHHVSLHIFHTVLHMLHRVLTRRICLTIKSISWWSFPSFLSHCCVILGWYCEEILHPSCYCQVSNYIDYDSCLLGVYNIISYSIHHNITCEVFTFIEWSDPLFSIHLTSSLDKILVNLYIWINERVNKEKIKMFKRVKMTTGKQQIVGHYEADLKGVIMKKIDKKKWKYLLL